MTTPPEAERIGLSPAPPESDPEKFQLPAPLPLPRRRPGATTLLDPEPRWLRAAPPASGTR